MPGPSVSLQKTTIGSSLNSSLLLQYLFGIHTGVYFITVYLYAYRSRKTTKITPITGCLTALFVVVIYECFAQWYNTTIIFSKQGSSRSDLFALSFFGPKQVPKWIPVLSILANDAGYIIADGLMIWRCFHVTNYSISRLALPLLFFSTEIVLAATENIIFMLQNFKPGYDTQDHLKLFDNIDASMVFITAGTSFLASFTIVRQIYTSTTGIRGLSRKRYAQIIEIVIQSSVVYSLASLSMAICTIFLFVTGNPYTSLTASTILRYLNVIGVMVTGLSPTLMVARLALASEQSDNSSTIIESISYQAVDTTTTMDQRPPEALGDIESYNSGTLQGLESENYAHL